MVKLARGDFDLHYRILDQPLRFKAMLKCSCPACTGWIGLGFPAVAGKMVSERGPPNRAVVKTPEETVVMYNLFGKAPASVQPIDQDEQASILEDTKVEVMDDGYSAMTFTLLMDTEETDLKSFPLIFAGGVKRGQAIGYHGAARGGITLDLQGEHYSFQYESPSSPPSPPVIMPQPPPPPSCFHDGSLDSLAIYSCQVQLTNKMDFEYSLKSDELRARVKCPTCQGWVGVGFAPTKTSSIGSTTVIGLPPVAAKPTKTYAETFQATGCCNANPPTDWWEKQGDTKVWNDMLAYCSKVVNGKANARQIETCGCGNSEPAKCTKQSEWAPRKQPMPWTMTHLSINPTEITRDGWSFKKDDGDMKSYDASAVTSDASVVELHAIAPRTDQGSYYGFCLTKDASDDQYCSNGASVFFLPGLVNFMCSGNKVFEGTFEEGSAVLIKFDASTNSIQISTGTSMSMCPSGSSSFYAKLFIYSKGDSISGIHFVTAAEAAASVRKYLVEGGASADLMPLANANQTLTATSFKQDSNGATMAFTSRLGPGGILIDPRGIVNVVYGSGTSSTLDYAANENPWHTMPLHLDVLASTSSPPPPPPPAQPAPPPPSCSDSSLASLAGYPCTAKLSAVPLIELHYHMDSSQIKMRVYCADCKGWLAIGFSKYPGAMIGATAVIATPSGLALYFLGGKSESSVVPLEQQTLTDSQVISNNGLTMFFTAKLGENGIPKDLSTADLIYAMGTKTTIGWHDQFRDGKRLQLTAVAEAAPKAGSYISVEEELLETIQGLEKSVRQGNGDDDDDSGMSKGVIGVMAGVIGLFAGCLTVGLCAWFSLREVAFETRQYTKGLKEELREPKARMGMRNSILEYMFHYRPPPPDTAPPSSNTRSGADTVTAVAD